MRKQWNNDEIKFLLENYSNKTNEELAVFLKKTQSAISNKANDLNLKKSKNHKSKMIGKRNKMVGRDLTFEKIKEIASQYKSRGELQLKDSSVYRTAREMGVLDEVCSHMIDKSYSIPQLILNKIIKILFNCETLYNSRKILSPYEVDVFIPKYNIGFEYNGKGWHDKNINDELKLKKAKDKNIKLFILTEKNRRYESDIKNQLVEFIPELTLITNMFIDEKNILSIDIGNIYEDVYDLNTLLKIANKYNSYVEFRKNESSTYTKLRKLKKLDLATNHMCCRRKKRNIQEVVEKINKYTKLKDLLQYDYGTYIFVKKHKLEHLLVNLEKRSKN
jgi:hypothetical protein